MTTLLSEAKERYSYCSTQVNVPPGELKTSLHQYCDSIPDEDVNEPAGGREKESHVTILYGIKSAEGLAEIKKVIPKVVDSIPSIKVTLDEVSMFDTNPEFDVLKISVTSPAMFALHKLFKAVTEWESDYPDYKPHLTIAYLKKGTGKKYIGDTRFKGQSFEVPYFLFCNNEGGKTKVSLKKEEPVSEYRQFVKGQHGL